MEAIIFSQWVWVEVGPFKLDYGVGVDPFGWDFGVESKLLDFNGSKLIQVFGSG